MQTQTPADQAAAGPSRPYKRPACNSCRVAHVACENARPCHRCNLLGKGEMCQDANVKKRGRPRKSAAPGTPKGSRTDEDPSPCSKRARTGNDPKPALPAVLPRPTSAAASSAAATTTAAATSDSTIGHHSPPPPLAASAAPSADLPRLPPPSSLLRLGQQTDFPSTLSSTTLPPLPPLSAAPAAPFLYPSFIISLFQNAAGVTPLGASTSPPQPQQLQQAVAAPLASRPTTTPAPTQAPAVTAGADARGGFSEANLMHILDSIKEIRETNEQLRKEMSEIKHENAFLKKEKEELRVKLEEHLAQEQ